ncbi:hypothetical protein NEFER03_2112 [Nematocida sp. LUAm3]|nr:hypothetical protein NEFER03_2112 [Nematocida sp. LUAm3]KAI5175636.1 hypothetical protein NEFER02_1523 [Nematocida sp. LUAm2]KAI5178542.1 hypothetical protein NEFER01_1678 [Nematocida sp. LUAm1]
MTNKRSKDNHSNDLPNSNFPEDSQDNIRDHNPREQDGSREIESSLGGIPGAPPINEQNALCISNEYEITRPQDRINITILNYNPRQNRRLADDILRSGRPGDYTVTLDPPSIRYRPFGDLNPQDSQGMILSPNFFKRKDPYDDPFKKYDPDNDHFPPPGGSNHPHFI